MKQFLFFTMLLLCLASCETPETTDSSLTRYIPRKAAVIIKTEDPKALATSLKNNNFITAMDATALSTFVAKQQAFINETTIDGETLFCYTPVGRNEYEVSIITEATASLFKNDSLALTTDKGKIKKTSSVENPLFYLIENEAAIFSSSQLLLENVIRERKEKVVQDEVFHRAYDATSSNAIASILLRGEAGATVWRNIFPEARNAPLDNAFSWLSADIDLNENDIVLSGVAISQDSIGLKLELLKNTQPVPNRIAEITPLSALSVSAVTHRDWGTFKDNQALFQKRDAVKFNIDQEEVFNTFQEVGMIHLPESIVVIGVSGDVTLTEGALAGNDMITTFRDIEIREMGAKAAFAKAYKPLLPLPEVTVFCNVDDFFIFGENQTALETIIANYQNNATLAKSETYQNTARRLSSAASYLHVEILGNGHYKSWVSDDGRKKLSSAKLDAYPYLATQLVQERDFMHFNFVLNQNEAPAAAGAVSQIANVKLNADITMSPQLVKNHRTKGMDIVVQDINNTLYLISNVGKVLWQKELDGQVKGDVQQVDLYRNGRLQLAFVTDKTFYILDRNGNEIKPFPLSFKDPITQPLAIFDYENNRNYRFVIVQNDEVLMYDKKAEPVTGFKFSKAESEVIFPPKHIRLANKDYIVIATNSGNVNILSRTGKSRIEVEQKINLGDTPLFDDGNNFLTYTVNGDKIAISQSGKITENATDIGSDATILIDGRTTVSMRENDLRIKGKKVELPFGTYSKPVLATVGKSEYVGFTNVEAKEVFLYNSKGEPLENLPVYGISKPSLGYLERGKSFGFVTQGDASSILIYKVN
ncbi:hypothetical protein EAX61_13060 [Dokdonia sinensis]|uniref:Uncharacterized protein n=1 Tax=Dokdonia sinensis TaxID=2479847 RepID=A0A3M0FVC3_9FLAO|nr:hypothetical protein [Dokdonia sinensis]RMB56730.1 hypothetical protein EAX61_13060 [Dokdonia sinensis]